MAKFHEVLAKVFGGEEFYKGDAKGELEAAYDEDFSIPTAKIGQLETQLTEASTGRTADTEAFNAERNSLKAKNYDLLMKIPATDDDTNEPPPTGSTEKEISIEDLFTRAASED